MSIRPVDMQIMMPRSVEVQKTNQNETMRPQAQHQQFAQQVQKNVEIERQTVMQSNKAEVDKDGKGNSGQNARQRRQRGSEKDARAKENAARTEKTSMLDISV